MVDLPSSDSGMQMPQLGLGTWKSESGVVSKVVKAAIEAGYRSIDCACDYGNEKQVGQGIKDGMESANIKRSDLFITSKLWNTYHRPEHVRVGLEKTLSDLDVSYLDLFLIHFPISLKFVPIEKRYPPEWVYDPNDSEKDHIIMDPVPISETWKAMEALVDEGLVRHIGISNFPAVLIMELLTTARIRPAVLQVELHPYLQQNDLFAYCKREKIALEAYSSLGGVSYTSLGMDKGENLLEDPVLESIAKKHGKSPAQVALRWGLQRGTIIIPKTSKVERLKENLDLVNWKLEEEDMKEIAGMDRGSRYNNPGIFCANMGLPIPIFD